MLTRDHERYIYQYDAFNRRVSKCCERKNGDWQKAWEHHYLYIGQKEIGAVNDQGKTLELRILGSGKGAEIGAAIALELYGRTYVPIHDQSGNIALLIDRKTGKTVEAYAYTAFGEEKIYNEKNPRYSCVGNPWHFSSKRLDLESGWIYFGRRYYDPSIGRWTTPDPIGFQDGPNLYAYVKNNPLTHFDEYGLYRDMPPLIPYREGHGRSAKTWRSGGSNCSSAGVASKKGEDSNYLANLGRRAYELGYSAYETTRDTVLNILQMPRVQGSLQAMGGLAEAGAGGAMILKSGGVMGVCGGWAVMAHGADQFTTGLEIAITGEHRNTVTADALQRTGLSESNATLINDVVSLLATTTAIAVSRASQAARAAETSSQALSNSVGHEIPRSGGNESAMLAEPAKIGGQISGYTHHGLNQAIGRDGGRGVSPQAILDAVKNPQKITPQSGGRAKYSGRDATVVLDSEGKIITVYGKQRGPQVWDESRVVQPYPKATSAR